MNGEPSRVLVVLPDDAPPEYTLRRIERLIAHYFPAPANTVTFSCPGSATTYRAKTGVPVQALSDAMLASNDALVVSDRLIEHIKAPTKRIYILDHDRWRVRLVLTNGQVDERDYPQLGAHSFNRNGPRGGNEYWTFFPYGYLFREYGLGGPIDEFGFRIDEDLESLRQRNAEHKLVAILGSSAAWSWYTFHEEQFSEVLERRLQAFLDGRQRGERVTVLNFGVGGAVLLQEMITWMLHVERLRPELVISHDGPSDFYYGIMADPALLHRGICTQYQAEHWGRKLHDRYDVPPRIDLQTVSLEPVNVPRPIVNAYLERKRQLDRWVKASGAHHIAALQPYAKSKQPTDEEAATFTDPRYVRIDHKIWDLIPRLYAETSKALNEATDMDVFNVHEYFSRFGVDRTLFQDPSHTTPEGDEVLADAYYDYIVERNWI